VGFAALLLNLPGAPECDQVCAEDQDGLLLMECRQSFLDPSPNGPFSNPKDARNLVHRVGAVGLDASPIWPSDTRLRSQGAQT
jgi:hypothetical protein